MKSLMILSSKDGDSVSLEFTQVIKVEEKEALKQSYCSSPIGVFFFDVPEDEKGALALGLFQVAQDLLR